MPLSPVVSGLDLESMLMTILKWELTVLCARAIASAFSRCRNAKEIVRNFVLILVRVFGLMVTFYAFVGICDQVCDRYFIKCISKPEESDSGPNVCSWFQKMLNSEDGVRTRVMVESTEDGDLVYTTVAIP
jgi:hypothetical protein